MSAPRLRLARPMRRLWTLAACAKRGIEPYIATSRDPHHPELAAALRAVARSAS